MNWEEWSRLVEQVVRQITSCFQPDMLVIAMNGGLVPGGIIASRLQIKDVRPVSIGRKGDERYFLYPLTGNIGDVRGVKILIIEDDVPTGKSVQLAKEYFLKQGAREVKIACVFKFKGIPDIDFFAQEVDTFPRYPWKETNLGNR